MLSDLEIHKIEHLQLGYSLSGEEYINSAIEPLVISGQEIFLDYSIDNFNVTGGQLTLQDKYVLLAGKSGGQTINGSISASGNLTLSSTSHATKGKILFGTSAYDEVNNRLGIGTTSPAASIQTTGNISIGGYATISTAGSTIVTESWHLVGAAGEPAFQNSWVTAAGINYDPAFLKDPFGFVHLRGWAKDGTTDNAHPIFTLPAGYRPLKDLIFPALSGGAAVEASSLRIASDGSVVPRTGGTVWFFLDGISFQAGV